MKAELIDGNMQLAFDKEDNAELKEYADSVLKAVFNNLSEDNNCMVIQQNEQMKQMMIMSCTIPQMIEIIKKYLADYQAEIVFIGENRMAKNAVIAVSVEKEEKSGIYEMQEDCSLVYSKVNANPLIARILRSLK